jgi:spore coat polysaccharide biosynthesis protein SpsF (cytidylyltransferase family)
MSNSDKKSGIFITARLGSKRVEQKHLLPVDDKPILYYLLGRIKKAFQKEIEKEQVQVIIATSDEPENRTFERFTGDGVSVFYGDVHNIPLRHLQTAEGRNLDAVISVDGDDILCSVEGMKAVFHALEAAPYVQTAGLPLGMNVMGYTTRFLKESLGQSRYKILETGWTRLFDQDRLHKIPFSLPDYSYEQLRFTLDYHEDHLFFKAVIEDLADRVWNVSDAELINLVMKKHFYRLNEAVANEYWENFHRQKRQEEAGSL